MFLFFFLVYLRLFINSYCIKYNYKIDKNLFQQI